MKNYHIYESHLSAAKEILEREPINEQPLIKLKRKPKGIKKLENTLELMV